MKNFKTIFRNVICVALALVLASAATITVSTEAQAASKGYFFKYEKTKATPGKAAAKFIKAAGKAKSSKKANSCATKGYDYTYEYDDFKLGTYTTTKTVGAKEYVSYIELTSDKVSTAEGIKIGSSESLVKSKYKTAKKNFGVYTAIKGNTKITIAIDNGKASEIKIMKK